MLLAEDVTVRFGGGRPVLDGCTLALEPGQSLGLAGPSGCGKSTLARVLALLLRPEQGVVRVDGERAEGVRHRAPRHLRTRVAIVFQQPRLAVDPRMNLHDVIAEPLRAVGRRHEVGDLLPPLIDQVALTGELLRRRPHEVSDGQLQRACVARALSLGPRYLVCDEMTTMLDASTQAHLVEVVQRYRRSSGAGVLAISHDPMLLDRWCDSTTVLAQAREGG